MLNYVLHLLTNLLLLLQTHPAWHNLWLCNTRLLLKRLLYSRKLPFGYNFIISRYTLHPKGYKIGFATIATLLSIPSIAGFATEIIIR